ncbi:hypothetical protein ACS0PU_004904 [Formica fusca]
MSYIDEAPQNAPSMLILIMSNINDNEYEESKEHRAEILIKIVKTIPVLWNAQVSLSERTKAKKKAEKLTKKPKKIDKKAVEVTIMSCHTEKMHSLEKKCHEIRNCPTAGSAI